MFGGPAPEQTPEEIEASEHKAKYDIQVTLAYCAALYLSPFAIDYLFKLF